MATRRRRRVWYDTEPRDPRLWLYGPVPSGFWNLAENRHLYVEWLGEQLGFTQMEDWYRVTRRHFQRHRGDGLLGRKFHDSPSALLKDVFPHYDWKEWLFVHVPRCFWRQRANRRRYLDWLGRQLGFKQPEDWARLRAADVLHYRGKGPLKHLQFRIEPLVKEYLADRSVPATDRRVQAQG